MGGRLEDVGCAIGVSGAENLVALVLEEGAGEGSDVGVVVDEEDGVGVKLRGSARDFFSHSYGSIWPEPG